MNTSKHTPGQPCACCILLRTGEPLESRHGEQPCSDISRIELCPKHAAAPAMYEALRVAVNHIAFGRYARAEEIMLKAITKAEGNAQ